MPIPRVTCSADVSIGVAATSGGYLMNLSASATNGPITEYRWTILFTPSGGSAALNSGDFTSGVAVGQNVSFTAPDGVFGTYVVQCVATNSTGPSNPYIDGETGQQNLIVADGDGVEYPGDFQYSYGTTLRSSLTTLKSLGGGGGGADENVKVSATDTTAGNLQDKINAINGIQESIGTPGGNENLTIEPNYGSSANTVCEGNDGRLADARTPTSHATSHQTGGGDEVNVGGLSGVLADDQKSNAIRTTDGPTLLNVGSVSDGQFLQRSGANIIGAAAGGSSPLTTKGDLFTYDTGDARLPVGSDDQVLIADSGEATGIKWGNLSDSRALWKTPSTPHASDEEFGSLVFPASMSRNYTKSASALDPYAAFSSGDCRELVDKSWILLQPPGNAQEHYIYKAYTFPTNAMVWCRIRGGHRDNVTQTNNDATIGLGIYQVAPGAVGAGANICRTSNSIELLIYETDANNTSWQAIRHDGSFGDVNFGPDIDSGVGMVWDYCGIHKLGTTYHYWLWNDAGQSCYCGKYTHSSIAPAYIAIQFLNAQITDPGNLVMGVDFIRVVESATFIPIAG